MSFIADADSPLAKEDILLKPQRHLSLAPNFKYMYIYGFKINPVYLSSEQRADPVKTVLEDERLSGLYFSLFLTKSVHATTQPIFLMKAGLTLPILFALLWLLLVE